jgi:hypothetical protein
MLSESEQKLDISPEIDRVGGAFPSKEVVPSQARTPRKVPSIGGPETALINSIWQSAPLYCIIVHHLNYSEGLW